MPKPITPLSTLIGTRCRLIPVLHVENADHAEPLAEALFSAGVVALEVTLRSAVGLEVIRRMRKHVPDAVVGAGTVTRPEQIQQVADAGALFAVSPGLTERLATAAQAASIPLVPGAVTPSEMLAAREWGFSELKFFPADLMGGTAMLKHVLPLFPDLSFCPTGGINDETCLSYLDLPNCFAAGGAYLAPRDRIEAGAFAEIAEKARKSVKVATRG